MKRFACLLVLGLSMSVILPLAGQHRASAADRGASDRGNADHADKKDEKAKAASATFEVYKDKSDQYRWRLRSRNGQVIATSGQGYDEKRSCTDAIDSIKRSAADAPVKEVEAGEREKQ